MNKAALISRIRDLSVSMDPIPTDQSSRLQSLPSIQCIAFDFYGTMFLSGVGDIGIDEEQNSKSRNLFAEALRDSDFTTLNDKAPEEGLKNFSSAIREYKDSRRSHGIDYPEPDIVLIWYEVLNKLLNDGYIKGDLTRETAQRFAVEYEFRFNAVWPVPDLMDTLESLRKKGSCWELSLILNSIRPWLLKHSPNNRLYQQDSTRICSYGLIKPV